MVITCWFFFFFIVYLQGCVVQVLVKTGTIYEGILVTVSADVSMGTRLVEICTSLNMGIFDISVKI